MRGARTRIARTALGGVAVALVSLLTACGSDTKSTASTATRPSTETIETIETIEAEVTAATVPATAAAPTTAAKTTTTIPETTPTTTAVETTVAPTTLPPTTLPLPVPAEPPADTRGHEPVVELGSIEIPRIGLAAAMFEGIRLTTLDRGPGHWPGTAMPGTAGNVVVAGHRTSHNKPFRHLDQLEPGDEVIFTTPDGRFVYHVVSTEIVKPDAIHITDQTAESTATLFACHPVGSTKERIVIHLTLATV